MGLNVDQRMHDAYIWKNHGVIAFEIVNRDIRLIIYYDIFI